ncbi:MAG TPA: YraN family protein, partial [Leptospiraceae bacterium]|nr:YraN family protein [Leptospiraceae bacterium]
MEKVTWGKVGEDKASKYLEEKGFQVLERNFRNRLGEIDIIALEKETIYFIEVKNWKGNLKLPLEIFTKKKIGIMRKLAEYFFYTHPKFNQL